MSYEEDGIHDIHGKLFELKDRVVGMDDDGEAQFGTVKELVEIDGDVDDEGRSYMIPPGIRVEWEGGGEEVFRAFNDADYRVTREPHWVVEEVDIA